MDKTKSNIVLAAAALSGFCSTFAASSINIALKEIELPPIEGGLGLSTTMLAWTTLVYVVGAGALLMPAGRLADMFGRLKVFLIGVAGLTFFAFASAFATTGSMLIAMRALQGLFVSAVFATNIALSALSQPPGKSGRGLGILTAMVYLGAMTGPLLGGPIVYYLGWRFLLGLVGVMGLLILALSLSRLRGVDWKEPREKPFDKLGAAIWFVAMPALIMGFTLLPDLLGILMAVAGALGLAVFVWQERRAADPLLNMTLLRRNRLFASSNAAALINYSANYALMFLAALYLRYNLDLDPTHAALVLTPGVAAQTLISPFAGRLADRLHPRIIVAVGMALCMLGLLSFAFLAEESTYWHIISTLCVLGVGFGLFASPVAHMALGSVDKSRANMASATLSTTRVVGQGVSLGIAGLVMSLLIGHEIDGDNPTDVMNLLSSVRISFAIFAGLCLLGLVVVLIGTRRPPQDQIADAPN